MNDYAWGRLINKEYISLETRKSAIEKILSNEDKFQLGLCTMIQSLWTKYNILNEDEYNNIMEILFDLSLDDGEYQDVEHKDFHIDRYLWERGNWKLREEWLKQELAKTNNQIDYLEEALNSLK